jgi:hypothetical protein
MLNKIFSICLNVILAILLVVVGVLGLALTFIEGRFIVSLEWTIYPDIFNTFIRYFFRLLLAISLILYAAFEFINIFKRNKSKAHLYFGINVGYCVLGILLFIFASNYIDIVGLILPFVLILIKSCLIFLIRSV